LAAQLLGDGEPGGVVRRAVDAEAAGQLLDRLAELELVALELTVGVERLDVGVDPQRHGIPPAEGSGTASAARRRQTAAATSSEVARSSCESAHVSLESDTSTV